MRSDPILLTIPNFLPPDVCRAEIARAEAIGFAPAPITTRRGFVMMPEVRNNTRVMLDDGDLAARLFTELAPRLASLCEPPVGLNERLRYYKYGPAECFRWHHDGSFRRANGEESELTFLVYLNDEFEGGETEFEYRSPSWPGRSIRPQTGMALIFTHRVQHQGAPVASGTKYVLRSDVMFRRREA